MNEELKHTCLGKAPKGGNELEWIKLEGEHRACLACQNKCERCQTNTCEFHFKTQPEEKHNKSQCDCACHWDRAVQQNIGGYCNRCSSVSKPEEKKCYYNCGKPEYDSIHDINSIEIMLSAHPFRKGEKRIAPIPSEYIHKSPCPKAYFDKTWDVDCDKRYCHTPQPIKKNK